MEKFEVTILGCGSALPTRRHNGSAQIVNVREKYFLVDCAEGTQVFLRENRVHLNRMNHVFISHLHGDHCFGLMGLISTQNLLGRIAPLHIYGSEALESLFRPHINYFCPNLTFDVTFHPVDTHAHAVVYEDNSLTVYSIPLKHRIRCCGYLFREKPLLPHIRRDAIDAFGIPISQINNIKAGMDWTTPEGDIIPNRLLTTPAAPPRSFAYLSDTTYSPNLAPLLQGVDLLYHEATFASEHKLLARQTHHSTAAQAAQMAKLCNARRLLIGHFSSRYKNEGILLAEAQDIFPETIAAKEGLTIDI